MKGICLLGLVLLGFTQFSIAQSKRIVVAQDGTGDFKTVQQAINAVKDSNTFVTTIYIRNGVYKEKLTLPESKRNIRFIGEQVDKTVLTYDDYASKKDSTGKNIGTSGSSGFFIFGSDISAENITFENSAGPVGQAVAVRSTGDRIKFINCRFLGFQDTLYTHGTESRQYFFKCYIEGTVDFIFGSATCLFDSCTIYAKGAGYYTAASTPENKKFGYVFLHCKLTGSAPAGSFYLGRPWRPYAKVVFMECDLGNMVKGEGWHNWDKTDNEKTAFYAEYNNHGEGAATDRRVGWSHQLTAAEASAYTIKNIFSGWDPGQTTAPKEAYDFSRLKPVELPMPNSRYFGYEQAAKRKNDIYNLQQTPKYFGWKNPTSGGAVHINKNDEIEVYQFTVGIYQHKNDSGVYYGEAPKDTFIVLKNTKECVTM